MKGNKKDSFDGTNVRRLLEESHMKFVTKRDLPEAMRVLARGANIDPQITKDSYNKITNSKNILVNIDEFSDQILTSLNNSIYSSPILNQGSGSSIVKAILLLNKLKNLHKSEKTLYCELSWLIETLADGKIYEKSKAKLISNPPLISEISRKIAELKYLKESSRGLNFKGITIPQLGISTDKYSSYGLASKSSCDLRKLPDIHKPLVKSQRKIEINFENTLSFTTINLEKNIENLGANLLQNFSHIIFKGYEAFKTINSDKLSDFSKDISDGYYENNCLHNQTYACDTLHMLNYILSHSEINTILEMNSNEINCLFIAGLVSNYKHPAVNEEYLAKAGSEITITYNNKFPLENYHISEAIKLMKTKPSCNILENKSLEDQLYYKTMMIKFVLSTNSKKLKKLNKMLTIFCPFKEGEEIDIVSNLKSQNFEVFQKFRRLILKLFVAIGEKSFLFKTNEVFIQYIKRFFREIETNEIKFRDDKLQERRLNELIENAKIFNSITQTLSRIFKCFKEFTTNLEINIKSLKN